MKKYDIYKKSIQINWKNRMDIAPWCTDLDPEPEKIAEFDSLEAAREELKKYNTEVYTYDGTIWKIYEVIEYIIQENDYDEDGEIEEYGDEWDVSVLTINIEDEEYNVVKTCHSYKEANEYIINDDRELHLSFVYY